MIHFKDNKNKSALSTRWAQMSKQEQIIERKKIEIQAKLESQKQAAALAAQAKLSNPTASDDKGSKNIFSNDGSFMNQFKALLEKQKQDKQEKEDQEKQLEEIKQAKVEVKEPPVDDEEFDRDNFSHHNDERRKSSDRGSRDKQHRWSDKSRNRPHSPSAPVMDDRKKNVDGSIPHNIPPLMQIPVMPPSNQSPDSDPNKWMSPNSDDEIDSNTDQGKHMGPRPMPPGPMPPNYMGPSLMGPGPGMPTGPMGHGPNMGPPNMLHGSGPNMGPGGMPGPMGPGPNMGMGPNMGPGPMMGPRGPMPPGPMPPFMGPPNFPMPPNFMGPNGPGGPCGPMPPNMCGPNMQGPGPNGPMPPFYGPPFPNMMRPNGPPPNSMMPPNPMNGNMPYMGPRPPFGPNGPPNFGNGNGPPMPFMPNHMQPHMNTDSDNPRGPHDTKIQNIPPPMPPSMSLMQKPKDLDPDMKTSQVLSADAIPPSVHRAATEVASNGDHWENVLKAIHSQDQNLWFLHNTNSNEYKTFRELVDRIRSDNGGDKKPKVKPEDKYEPEFSLEDDDSYDDSKHGIKEESGDSFKDYGNYNQSRFDSVKREASSQSDEESDAKRERRKKKSRWSDEPPSADIKPPGVVAPLPPAGFPGTKLSKIDEEGVKLTTVNRNNQALMQYAMTNYGTTNLSAEDWKKCEDNFKLNLLYQDMLKKRQEVERLAAAGKYKYEYDSDEDTAEGTWEHKLRAKEMNATEKWADELTKQAAGKHHIGDFLPPEELKKFMEKYSAVKSGKEPDLSDYKEFKLKEDNVGFKMLQKLGWSEGQGLGAEGGGIVDPINKANQPVANLGLGASTSDGVSPDDDEFDAYRKRMMLAYRFRPNPLNNPRRPYY